MNSYSILLVTILTTPLASAFTISESADFSNTTPTFLGVTTVGSNTVSGAVSTTNDRDLVSFTVPQGQQLDSFIFTSVVSAGESNEHFLGFASGLTPSLGGGGDFLIASVRFGDATVDENLLTLASFANGGNLGGTGVTAPLGAGDYTLFLNETASTFTYAFELNTSAIPEPSSALLLSLASIGLMRRRRV